MDHLAMESLISFSKMEPMTIFSQLTVRLASIVADPGTGTTLTRISRLEESV
jgi:hypothetical protein